MTTVEVLDLNKKPVGTALEGGKSYYVRVVYQSGFDVGGCARLRLYRYDAQPKRLYPSGEELVHFNPKEIVTEDFGTFCWGSGSYTLIATIDYQNNGDDPSKGWQAERFDGKYDESTYDNNQSCRRSPGIWFSASTRRSSMSGGALMAKPLRWPASLNARLWRSRLNPLETYSSLDSPWPMVLEAKLPGVSWLLWLAVTASITMLTSLTYKRNLPRSDGGTL